MPESAVQKDPFNHSDYDRGGSPTEPADAALRRSCSEESARIESESSVAGDLLLVELLAGLREFVERVLLFAE